MSASPSPANTGSALQPVAAGLLTALVGFGSSFAIVIQGLSAVGADTAQIATALAALCLAIGSLTLLLSQVTRQPISLAWSTPGAALLAATGTVTGGLPAALGAFCVTAGLIVLTGFWRPLGRWVAAIPPALANAMLAGVLLKLCLAPFLALPEAPVQVVSILAVFLVVNRYARHYAVLAALACAMLWLGLDDAHPLPVQAAWPALTLMTPTFSWEAVVSIALPLYLVTMASQNIPGLAILGTYGYRPPPGPIFRATGLASLLIAPLGALSINLAAITATLAAGPDASPDPARRYRAAQWAGLSYLVLALLAGSAAALVTDAPPLLIQAAAGLALLGAFSGALSQSLGDEAERLPAMFTFLVTASGITLAGIGPAFWGLIAGVVVRLALRRRAT